MASDLTEEIGNRIGSCAKDAYEVTVTKPATNWDDGYQVGTISVEGTSVGDVLKKNSGRNLFILHDGKQATFTGATLTSDAFTGSLVSGTWTLRLSGCGSPPSALIIKAHADCHKP
ncbi:MAG: hypothetical protein JO159_00870 [Acidobacteria bacterium]|nr:hypothetical protein [Acidobacteriota bacterium]MBV9624749.1 hypothetical protein [Acidobacteriota bacterium]